jgi:prepilin-type N-terminal cleavage/methylation domain-containing protein
MKRHKNRIAKKKGEAGFTLIEVLVAMIILAIGILGLAPMLVISMQGNQFSREVSEAAYLAQDRIEQLRNQATITPIPFYESSYNLNGEYNRSVVVADRSVDNTVPPGVYRLTVIMSWVDKDGKSHSTSYISYKAK